MLNLGKSRKILSGLKIYFSLVVSPGFAYTTKADHSASTDQYLSRQLIPKGEAAWSAFCVVKSIIERRIGGLIRQQFPAHKIQENIRPKWLRSSTNQRLELDYFLPELKLAFEIQGGQHYQYVPHFHPNPGDFERQLERDREKRSICREKGIVLIEIASADDYDAVQSEILAAVNRFESQRLQNHILEKASQTIINIIALKGRLATLTRDYEQETGGMRKAALKRTLTHQTPAIKLNLEEMYELLRYLSIRAIQDFHGLLPYTKHGRGRMLELRRAGRTTEHEKWRGRRKNKPRYFRNMKRWV